MKQIEVFVDSVYQNASGNKKEIDELKAEMRSHLLEAVYELKKDGKSDQEAIKLSIERFGGEQEIRFETNQHHHKKRLFEKGLLFAAITALIVALLSFQFLYQREELNSNDFPHRINEKIIDILNGQESISEEVKNELEFIVQSNKRIHQIDIYNIQGFEEDELYKKLENSKPIYSYFEDVSKPKWLWAGYNRGGNGMGNWFVYTSAFGYYVVSFLILFSVSLFIGLYSRYGQLPMHFTLQKK